MSEGLPRNRSAKYIKIAVDIATCIARGEYREGQKILGRSSLAGRYSVSPETIRRALAVLEERKIVKLQPGVGVIVSSQVAAEDYLAEYGQHQILEDIQKALNMYLEERRKLDLKITQLTDELLEYTFKMATRFQRIHEFRVETGSPLVGKSLKKRSFVHLQEVQFCRFTAAAAKSSLLMPKLLSKKMMCLLLLHLKKPSNIPRD